MTLIASSESVTGAVNGDGDRDVALTATVALSVPDMTRSIMVLVVRVILQLSLSTSLTGTTANQYVPTPGRTLTASLRLG